MRTIFYSILTALCCATLPSVHAQAPSQAILINGNLYMAGNFATAARYDLNNQTYQVFDSIPARFSSDIIIRDNVAFVAADSLIVSYDIDTYQRIGTTQLNGVRKLALLGNVLIASTGYGGDSLHVRGYDATTLAPTFSIAGISGDCEGIAIHGDSAYVAVPGAFGTTVGKVAVINLQQPALVTELNLDSMGRGIDRIYASGGKIWTINSIAYANAWGVVSEIDPATRSITHHRVELNTLHSPGVFQNALYLRRGSEGVFAFDPSAGAVSDSMVLSGNFIAGTIDTVRREWLMTDSDYFSYGKLLRFEWNGMPIDTVDIGISPEAIGVDYRSATSRAEEVTNGTVKMWPVPVQDVLNVELSAPVRAGKVQILDMQGRVLVEQSIRSESFLKIDVSQLPAGVYALVIQGNGTRLQNRFVK